MKNNRRLISLWLALSLFLPMYVAKANSATTNEQLEHMRRQAEEQQSQIAAPHVQIQEVSAIKKDLQLPVEATSFYIRKIIVDTGGHFKFKKFEKLLQIYTNKEVGLQGINLISKRLSEELISAAFIATDPQMAEDMEKSIMLELANLTKFDGAGVSFIVDPNQGLHNNLIASRDFFNTYHVVKHLPNVFITGTMMTAAAVTAPIAVVSNTITYGGTIYTLVKDYQKADGNMELFKQNIEVEGGKAFALTIIDAATGNKTSTIVITVKSVTAVFMDADLKQ